MKSLIVLVAVLAGGFAAPILAQLPPNPTQLSSTMPPDAPPQPAFSQFNFAPVQRKFDIFAWQEFVALNWPVGQPGEPGKGIIGGFPGGDNPTVWESYIASSQVFQPDAKPPPPWGTSDPIPAFCPKLPAALKGETPKVMGLIAKGDIQDEFLEAFTQSPLFDVAGKYVRYEIRMNLDEYNQILLGSAAPGSPAKPWYVPANQIAPIVFPAGVFGGKTIGAMEVKAAWRQITTAQKSRFHSSWAYITYAPDKTTHLNSKCAGPFLMGLVGLHIIHKTASTPQWVWATFEHVDNAPPPAHNSGKSYSFNNDPKCTLAPLCADQPPAGSDWDGDPGKTFKPVQVLRATPISAAKNDPETGINPYFQKMLRAVNAASVWQYYELVDAQWSQRPGTLANPTPCYHTTPFNQAVNFACDGPGLDQGPGPVPAQLTNTTAETYFQAYKGNKQSFMGSCMGCHSNATVASGAPNPNAYSDFSFLIGDAQAPSNVGKAVKVLRKSAAPR
jgi:hypothetical protein